MQSLFRLRWLAVVALFVATTTAPFAQPIPHVATTPHLTPADEAKQFRLPPGFEAQLVAAEPDIQKPMNMGFDAKGRLWLTDTIEYPFPVEAGKKGRDRVVILSDFDETGKAQKKTVFADGLNIPIGLLPLPSGNECLVFSIPYIYYLKDADGDGKAEIRKELYGVFGTKDTHGMVNGLMLGLDGWVYACHGFSNESTVKGSDGQELKMQSGNTFRFKIDGTHLEAYSRGQVNPFGMAMDPYGFLYTADCHSKPITQIIRGAYYDSFGKAHDGLGYGPNMIGHEHGSTALCGLVYYDADQFPANYRGTMFLGNVVTNRVNFDRIEFNGSSPRAVEQPDFLTCTDPWFRPVDLKLGPDGALYVADFYNRIIGHYEVPLTHPGRDRNSGRIWRIVYRGADGKAPVPKMPRADWTKATTEELVSDLGSENIVVRSIATQQLASRGEDAVKACLSVTETSNNPKQIAHALWVLERHNQLSDAILTRLDWTLKDPISQASAIRILAERTKLTEPERALVHTALTQGDVKVQRIAVEALGRHPNESDIPHLLKVYTKTPASDSHLKHTTKIAIRDVLKSLPNAIANVSADDKANRVAIAQVCFALQIPEASAFIASHIAKLEADAGRPHFAEGVRHIARYGKPDAIKQVLKFLADNKSQNLASQLAGYQAIQRGSQEANRPLTSETIAQAESLAKESLTSKNPQQVQAGIELAASLRLPNLREPLISFVINNETPEGLKVQALPAIAAIDAGQAIPLLTKYLTSTSEPMPIRERSAQVLASINQPPAHAALINAMATVPAKLAVIIAAEMSLSPPGAEALLNAIKNGKASPRLLQERIVQQRLNERKLPNLPQRIAELTKGLPTADEKMLALMNQRRTGFEKVKSDRVVGEQLFTKNCAICHQLRSQGAKIGPQLDGIGNRGIERLLEDILDPSRNVDQALRTSVVELKNGQVVSGLLLREEGEVLVMADAMGKEVRIPKNTIEERTTSLLSPMPANFAEQVSETEFYHLLAFLLEQRAEPPKK